ncbi:MAG: hypothetical protein QXJ68_02190 [Methanocellales archaeon]
MEKVDLKLNDGFINLTHHLSYVCCAKIKVYLNHVETYKNYILIKIKEKNEGEICRCICDYEVNMKIGPLGKGKYIIQIWGVEFESIAGELLWQKEVNIEIENEETLPNPASIYCMEQGGSLERIKKEMNMVYVFSQMEANAKNGHFTEGNASHSAVGQLMGIAHLILIA